MTKINSLKRKLNDFDDRKNFCLTNQLFNNFPNHMLNKKHNLKSSLINKSLKRKIGDESYLELEFDDRSEIIKQMIKEYYVF